MPWSRNTKWRQGSILDQAALKALQVTCGPREWAVVITHDCDLANCNLNSEPEVEVIVCEELTATKRDYLTGSYGRELHIVAEDTDGGPDLSLKVGHLRKVRLLKQHLDDDFLVKKYKISHSRLNILREWLSKRYNRHALPEALGDRIDESIDRARDKLKKHGEDIVKVLISHRPANADLPPNEEYEVQLAIVYHHDVEDGGNAIKASVESVQAIFNRAYDSSKPEIGRAYVECNSYSAAEFTLADAGKFIEIRWDDLSHRNKQQ